MNINNPTTFSTPDLTLGTANSSGSAGALRADDTILVYDTPNPAAVGASAVVGSASTSARRDHVHVGVGAITSTDEAIARYNGTAGALQNYTSNAPTISDAGIVSLTSGALKWPATAIASTDSNTMDDYQEGSWTPDLQDTGGNSAGTSTAAGRYTRIGNIVWFNCNITVTSTSGMTTSQQARVYGLPYTVKDESEGGRSLSGGGFCWYGTTLNMSTAGGYITVAPIWNTSYLEPVEWSSTEGVSNPCTVAEISADGVLNLCGWFRV